jgi:xanthine dehydrogenase YagR molybdenum-binding subunit
MAAWRRAIELSLGDEDTAKLDSIAKSRTEPAGEGGGRCGEQEAKQNGGDHLLRGEAGHPGERERHHDPMEPHATLAAWDEDGLLTLYDSTQMVVGTRKFAPLVLGVAALVSPVA